MYELTVLGAALFFLLSRQTAAHPACLYASRAPNTDTILQFCPQPADGACCSEFEEATAIATFMDAGDLSDECSQYYKQVACAPCHAYSGHLYEVLGVELGAADGLTMKIDFCDALVEACTGEIDFKSYGSLSYCQKHTGGKDQLWAYPIDIEDITFELGLVEAFPGLPYSQLPSDLICMHMTLDGDHWWLGGQDGQIVEIDAESPTSSKLVLDIGSGMDILVAYEEGLMDFAFSPAFNTNKFFYVSYTIQDNDGTKNRLGRFTYSSSSAEATKASYEEILTSEVKLTSIHSGGWCGFKPSDYGSPEKAYHEIYWTIGDGGPQQDPQAQGSNINNLLASIVRIEVPSGINESGYQNPAGNVVGGRPEICANGLRNPYRCAFDSMTDNLYCADVGHTKMEELDLIKCGKDYGWPRFEGSRCQEEAQGWMGDCDGATRGDFEFPIFEYCHLDYDSTESSEDKFTDGEDICGMRAVEGSAVIAGHVYHGQRFGDVLSGALLFADHQEKNIYYLVEEEGKWVPGSIISDGSAKIISFSEDNDGEQYVIGHNRVPYLLPCGDLCQSTCLEQVDAVTGDLKSKGCFADDPNDRALQLKTAPSCPKGQDKMSPQICAAYCGSMEGVVYFGVENAEECYCGGNGEAFDKHGILDSELCGTMCVGTPDKFCGGENAIQVYTFDVGTPAPVPDIDVPKGYLYIGCFADVASNRALTGNYARSETMSIEECADTCTGSTHFGTQYGIECFCSAPGDDYGIHGEDATCNAPCAGATFAACGGSDAISIYEYSGVAPPPTPEIILTPTPVAVTGKLVPTPVETDYSFVGCFVDATSDRALKGAATKSSSNTAEECAEQCEGSQYFGTEHSNECFCSAGGDDFDMLGTSSSCTMSCAGMASENCGGFNAISIYEYSDATTVPTPPEMSFIALDCLTDSNENRVLSSMTSSLSMTTKSCGDICEGSTHFGTQYGMQCWCGTIPAQGTSTSTDCNMGCAGDSSETCGGYNAMNVYEYVTLM